MQPNFTPIQAKHRPITPVLAVVFGVLFIAAAAFGVWAYSGKTDYKNNTQAKIDAAVANNTKKVQAADAKQYAEQAKSPYKTLTGPSDYGSVQVSYPKTWGAYVDTTNSNTPINAYFHDDYVPAPSTSSQIAQVYNLRIQIVSQPYSTQLQQYQSKLGTGEVTASAYSLPKVPKVAGTMLTGQIVPNSSSQNPPTGTMVMLPLRNTTLEIWTESPNFLSDFNNIILPNITFVP